MVCAVESAPTTWLTLGRGAATYTQAEAEAVLAGFAFGTTQLVWPSNFSAPTDNRLSTPPRAAVRSKWSYRIYDCAPNSPHGFGVNDLLVIAALDPGAGAAKYLAMEAILPDLNDVLAHIDVDQTFWKLPRDHLGSSLPPAGTPAWWLWRAWALLMGLENIGVAVAYKTLHHKRPWLFPIFDNGTMAKMGGAGAWQVLHDDLTGQAGRFTYLEQWFATQATSRGGVHLTRLRIHDILLWADTWRERRPLTEAGHEVLES
ncbi:MAG TPA: DUF6308 family protein [Streptosporangiaceae bacterium]|nr:DUF6308 family protein [Streptosporangiaceae bacterium]